MSAPRFAVELPKRMRSLPTTRGGVPVPWFVIWLDGEGEAQRETGPGEGRPEFRIVGTDRFARAVRSGLCWICGKRLETLQSFVLGPMCGVNRTSSEPPSHPDCAEFAARVCPFLSDPTAVRREGGLESSVAPAGVMLRRNPGVALVWTVRRGEWRLFPDEQGRPLIDIGEPVRADWWVRGERATREEVEASVEAGLPALRAMTESPDERIVLASQVAIARRFYPREAV